MESLSETAPMNERAASYIAGHTEEIMDSLLDMRQSEPTNQVIQEVESLGGMGTISMSLGLIEDVVQQDKRELSARNAEFVVALLQSLAIRNYLADHSGGQLSSLDLEELRDYFLQQI